MSDLAKKKCVPCEGGVDPLTEVQAMELMEELDQNWMLIDEAHLLVKEFKFKDFAKAMMFVNKIAAIAEDENHHPDLTISYNRVTVELTTHAIDGLSENDFILAAKIDEIEK